MIRVLIRSSVFSVLFSVLAIGCLETKKNASEPKDARVLDYPKGELKIGGKTLSIEIADADPMRERGLMYRKSLPENYGMLFIFETEDLRAFWMKNTFVPLSIGYFDRNKKLLEIHDMTPVKSEMQLDIPSYPSKRPAMYALEVPQGWFHKNGIKVGDIFTYLDLRPVRLK
jgi:uncharacterized protein